MHFGAYSRHSLYLCRSSDSLRTFSPTLFSTNFRHILSIISKSLRSFGAGIPSTTFKSNCSWSGKPLRMLDTGFPMTYFCNILSKISQSLRFFSAGLPSTRSLSVFCLIHKALFMLKQLRFSFRHIDSYVSKNHWKKNETVVLNSFFYYRNKANKQDEHNLKKTKGLYPKLISTWNKLNTNNLKSMKTINRKQYWKDIFWMFRK